MTAPQAPRQPPQNQQTSAQLPPGDPKTLESFLSSPAAIARLAEIASGFMKPLELTRLALVAVSKTPDLLKCSQASILRALIDAATLRIVPGGTMGRGFLVPRKSKITGRQEACFDPGWRGLADIARRSGAVLSIDAQVVYAADTFVYRRTAAGPILEHDPNLAVEDLGAIVAAYAIASMKEGPPQIEVLRRSDIDRIQDVSAAKAGPWASWFDEMARKSAVRRLCKYLPYDPELERAAAMSDDVETGLSTSLDISEGASLEDELAARDAKTNGAKAATTTPGPTETKALPEKSAAAAAVLGLDQAQAQRQAEKVVTNPGTSSVTVTAEQAQKLGVAPSTEGEKAEVKAAPTEKTEALPAQKTQDKPPETKTVSPGWPPCATCGKPITGDDEPVKTNLGEGKGVGWRHGACLPPGMAPAADGNAGWGMPGKDEPADAEPPPGVLEGERQPGED